jgi:phosphoribosylanthranilate isomerase
MLKIKVKASQMTNLTDARYFAAKEVEWLSFNFTEGSENYIDPMKAKAMFEWVEGPIIVAEFEGFSAADINFYTEGYQLSHVQVGMNTTVDDVFELKAPSVIKEIIVDEASNAVILRGMLRPFAASVEAFQLNFQKNRLDLLSLKSSNALISYNDLQALCNEFKIILAIDFQAIMLEDVLGLNLYGLSLQGGEEEKVGVKSFDELDEILEQLEVEEY